MLDATLFVLGFGACAAFGAVVASWVMWEIWLRRDPPKIEIVIDQALAREIDERIVMAWASGRGLVWMPRGMETICKGKSR